MVYEFKLPDIGEGVTEGEILKWHIKEGDEIKENDPLVEIMTDKVNVEIPSPKQGTVLSILAREGQIVKVGEPIIVIGENGEKPPAMAVAPTPAAKEKAPVLAEAVKEVVATERPREILATPATRKLARDLGVDLSLVRGSGAGGRITDQDVRAFAELRERAVVPPAGAQVNEEHVPFRGIRRRIAEKMVKSRRTAAHFTLMDEVDMTELVALREKAKAAAEKEGVKLTYLPFIIKALIPALKQYPYMNAYLDEEREEIVLKKYYNIGIATATDRGLIVPVVKDADRKSVTQLAKEIETLALRARAGELELQEVQGGTFTITSVGSIGGVLSTPIINYPEVGILAVHEIKKRPVVKNGEIEIRDMMYLALSFDHRVIDGAVAAEFTKIVIGYLEDPKLLLLE